MHHAVNKHTYKHKSIIACVDINQAYDSVKRQRIYKDLKYHKITSKDDVAEYWKHR